MSKKEFQLKWIFESFAQDPSFYEKRMFGGLSAYVHGKLMLVLCESPDDREWRGKTFEKDLWNGVLIATSHEHHESLMTEFKDLEFHPILGKWLYLPRNKRSFKKTALALGKLIFDQDPRIGVTPKKKK